METAVKRRLQPGAILEPPWVTLALVAVVAISLAAAVFSHRKLVVEPHRAAVAEAAQARATAYAMRVNQYVTERKDALERLSSHPDVLAALEDGTPDRDSWRQLAGEHLQPDARFYIQAGQDNSLAAAGNFVAHQMSTRVFEGEVPPPQGARIGGQWRLLFARPVHSGAEIAGALIISMPADSLASAMLGGDDTGRVELLQAVPDSNPGSLIRHGSAGDTVAEISLATVVPHWRLRFSATPAFADDIRRPWVAFTFTLILLAALTLTAAALVLRLAAHRHLPATAEGGIGVSLFRAPGPDSVPPPPPFPRHVFRDYDIRGKAGSELSPYFAEQLGKALGTRARELGEATLAMAADGRLSSPDLSAALCRGIISTGCDLVDLGTVPTPLMNYAINILDDTGSGIMVTASHNPPEDNGFKIVLGGHVLNSAEIRDLHQRMEEKAYRTGSGKVRREDIGERYMDAVVADVLPATGSKVVVDCGNGIVGDFAPTLLRRLGCEVTELHCQVDGEFPGHDPDPTVADNLEDLIAVVRQKKANLGIAFDGDGDRLVAVTATGRIVWPDELLMIFARDVVARSPGCDVIFDVKSTRRLQDLISGYGGRPLMWKTGHAHMRNKMAETSAPVGGEFSGHIFFNDRWYGFDDGLYAAARLLEILTLREQGLDDTLAGFPTICATPEIKIPVADEDKFRLVEALNRTGGFENGKITTLDGIRVEYPDGWGLVRASNTSAALTLRFEATTPEALENIMALFRQQLHAVDPELIIHF